jgi:hypothetical protein
MSPYKLKSDEVENSRKYRKNRAKAQLAGGKLPAIPEGGFDTSTPHGIIVLQNWLVEAATTSNADPLAIVRAINPVVATAQRTYEGLLIDERFKRIEQKLGMLPVIKPMQE